MSQIENVITTTFRARGGQAIAQMGSYAQSFGNVGSKINETTRMSERLNNQWRAFGTTIRYALAGGAIFGLTRMVTQLKDVQQQLGLIQAIGQPVGGTGIFSTSQVTKMGQQLQKSAVDALTPINEINDATINLLSTVQNVPANEIPSMITDIGRAAKLSQTPVEDLTKAATTMNIAFGRPNNLKTVQEFNRQWFALIKEAPGGVSAAPEIANQLAPLASMFSLGKGPVSGATSQRQMLSLVLGVLRTGSTPSTGIRGLSYLLQSIIQPTGKARGALASIGITPQSIEKEGVYSNLMKLLGRITKVSPGTAKRLGAMPEETLAALDESGGNLPGVPASEMIKLRTMIPRIHGIRAAVILAGQLQAHGQVLSLQQDLSLMAAAQGNQADQTHSMSRAWKDFQKRSRLQEASVALNALSLQVAQTFEPILNFAAGGATGLTHLAQRHRTGTKIAVGSAATMLAALGVARFLGFGSSLAGRLSGGLGSGLVRANAIQAAMSSSGVLGSAPQNPMYVVVVGQLFNPNSRPDSRTPGKGFGGGATQFGKKAMPWLEGAAAEGVLAGGASAGMLVGAGIVAPLAILGGAAYFGNKYGGKGAKHNAIEQVMAANRERSMPGSVAGPLDGANGQAYGVLDVNINHPDGTKERKRVKVPVNYFPRGVVPTYRGRAGNSQRGK